MASTAEQLRGLILSAEELRRLNPSWESAMVEDYLTIIENVVSLAVAIDVGTSSTDEIAQEVSSLQTSIGKVFSTISSQSKRIIAIESIPPIDRNSSRISRLEKRIIDIENATTIDRSSSKIKRLESRIDNLEQVTL